MYLSLNKNYKYFTIRYEEGDLKTRKALASLVTKKLKELQTPHKVYFQYFYENTLDITTYTNGVFLSNNPDLVKMHDAFATNVKYSRFINSKHNLETIIDYLYDRNTYSYGKDPKLKCIYCNKLDPMSKENEGIASGHFRHPVKQESKLAYHSHNCYYYNQFDRKVNIKNYNLFVNKTICHPCYEALKLLPLKKDDFIDMLESGIHPKCKV